MNGNSTWDNRSLLNLHFNHNTVSPSQWSIFSLNIYIADDQLLIDVSKSQDVNSMEMPPGAINISADDIRAGLGKIDKQKNIGLLPGRFT